MAQGRFCEQKDHGPDQTLIVAIVGIGDGNGTMTWLCQEHFRRCHVSARPAVAVAEGSIDQRCRHHVRGRVMDSAYYRDGEHPGQEARRPTECDACEPAFTEAIQAEASQIIRGRNRGSPGLCRREIDELPRGARMSYDRQTRHHRPRHQGEGATAPRPR